MAEFHIEESGEFDHRKALITLLTLLDQLFSEIVEDRNWLLNKDFEADIFPALRAARDQLGALIYAVEHHERSAQELDDYGLQGEPLRFKLQVVAFANNRAGPLRNRALERVSDGATGAVRVYRRALKGALSAIDGPLESLTKMLGVGEGLVEFKKAMEVVLDF